MRHYVVAVMDYPLGVFKDNSKKGAVMENKYFKSEFEYLDAQFKLVDIYRKWEQERNPDKKIVVKIGKKKTRPRNYAKEVKEKSARIEAKWNGSQKKGKSFLFDRIAETAGLDSNERLFLLLLLHSRLTMPNGQVPCAEATKTIFPKRQQCLKNLYCLSQEGRLKKSGLIEFEGKDVKISDRIYKKFLEIKMNRNIPSYFSKENQAVTSYADFLTCAYLLADVMWERTRVTTAAQSCHESKIIQDDLVELNERIIGMRKTVEDAMASESAKDFPLVLFSKKYNLSFEEQMVLIGMMQTMLRLRQENPGNCCWDEGYLQVMDVSRFLASSRDDVPRHFKIFHEDSALIQEGIIEEHRWTRDSLQAKEFTLATDALNFLTNHGNGAPDERLKDLGVKLREKAEKTGNITKPRFTLEDVVLEERNKACLVSSLGQLLNKDLIFKEWGFEEKIKYGTGITMLFAGPPGTGKTMAAEAVAGHIKKKVLIVDYSKLESCWVGETEKNIVKVFRTAKEKDAVLVFDEADAVFYSRSLASRTWEVRDVNVLLREIERFTGVVILTTNRHDSFDPALERRIAVRLEFGAPGLKERIQLWKRHFPEKAPLSQDIDFEWFANEFTITGAQIKNIALGAARRAAFRASRGEVALIMRQDILDAVNDEKALSWAGRGIKGQLGFAPSYN